MKKEIVKTVVLGLCSLLGLNSCSASTNKIEKSNKSTDMNTVSNQAQSLNKDSKKLVVFFSHTGENYNVGYIEKGNTHIIADMIVEGTGADIFEIVPEKDYPKNYNECIDLAKHELQQNARPAIKGDVAIDDYDVIFIGYPNWWGNPPMCVYSFIDKHNWDGKTVIPFITHEGSGMGGTDRKIAAECKGANTLVGKGLAVQGKVAQENQASAKRSVENWLNQLGLKK